jgi:hypothetical protein
MIDTCCLAEAKYTIPPLLPYPFSSVLRKAIEFARRTQECPGYTSQTLPSNHLSNATPKPTPSAANGKCIHTPPPVCLLAAHASTQGMTVFTIISQPRALLSKYQASRIGNPTATSRAPYIRIKLSTSFCDSASLGAGKSMTRSPARGRKIALMPSKVGTRPARAAMLGRSWLSAILI